MNLADNKCIPCRGGVPPVAADRAQALLKELGRGWSLNQSGHLERLYTFNDFAKAYNGPPTDPKEIEVQQQKLQDELQRRAEEARKKLEGQPK